jgi:hypothetical protein
VARDAQASIVVTATRVTRSAATDIVAYTVMTQLAAEVLSPRARSATFLLGRATAMALQAGGSGLTAALGKVPDALPPTHPGRFDTVALDPPRMRDLGRKGKPASTRIRHDPDGRIVGHIEERVSRRTG